jgi:hypothetical protein
MSRIFSGCLNLAFDRIKPHLLRVAVPNFTNRVLLLLALMAIVTIVDFKQKGREASKYREYGFILIAGAVGALLGFVNDLITSSISPDYFVFGKGLDSGDGLRWRAGIFGAKEGLSAGIIAGAVCLFATAQKTSLSPAQLRSLLARLWMPLAGAVLAGLTLPLAAGAFDPFHLAAKLESFLNGNQIRRFLRVWWIYTGLYAGLTLGLAAMIARTRRDRRR